MEQNKGFWYADWSFPIFVGLLSSGVFAGTHMYYLYGIGAFNEVAFVAMLKAGMDTGVYGAVAAFGASFLFARIIEGSLVGILDIGGAIQTGPFRAQRAAVYRVIRVAFDVEDRRFGVFRTVAEAIHQQPTADGAVRTGVTGFAGAQQFILPRFRQRYAGRKAQCRRRCACHTASADLKELPSADLHGSLLVSTLLTYVVLASRCF
jgi:hypothetical protein